MTEDERRAVAALIEAGRTLATQVEDVQIGGCANAPPHPADCPDCRAARDAIFGWAQAVVEARKAMEATAEATADVPQDVWIGDGDYESLVSGKWLLETQRVGTGFQWSATLLGGAALCVGHGAAVRRGEARYAAWYAVDEWLRKMMTERPPVLTAMRWLAEDDPTRAEDGR